MSLGILVNSRSQIEAENPHMQETRSQILKLIKLQYSITVNELAEALSISSMGVRQHLAVLEKDGLVEFHREKPKRGRPIHLYQLTEKGNDLFPSSYESFALNLLHEMGRLDGCGLINKVLRGRVKSHEESYAKRLEGKSLAEKVKILAEIRDEEGYMAEFSEDDEDYVLVEHNCPIVSIAEEYPHVCETELALFRRSLGQKIDREEHLMNGSHRCSYRIPKGQKTDKE